MITDKMEREFSATATASRTWMLRRYLLIVLVIPLILYPLPFFLVKMRSYPDWTIIPDSPVLDFGFQAAGQNDDIVIYGDSSANHGIDPSQMSKALNLKVLDIPSSLSVLLVDNDFPLQHYMELDKPPRLIVLYLTAWDMDYGDIDLRSNPPYTGLEVLVRYGSAKQMLNFFKRNPSIALQFPLMFYRANLNATGLLHRELIRREALQVAATNGHADTIATSHYDADCMIPVDLINQIRPDTVKRLSELYSTPQTKVLVFIAPIPNCQNAKAIVDREQTMLPWTQSKILPASAYVKDKYYSHLYASTVPQATQNLVDAIRTSLATSAHE